MNSHCFDQLATLGNYQSLCIDLPNDETPLQTNTVVDGSRNHTYHSEELENVSAAYEDSQLGEAARHTA